MIYRRMTRDEWFKLTDEPLAPIAVGDIVTVVDPAAECATVSRLGSPFVRISSSGCWNPEGMGLFGRFLVSGRTHYGLKAFLRGSVVEPVKAIKVVKVFPHSVLAVQVHKEQVSE